MPDRPIILFSEPSPLDERAGRNSSPPADIVLPAPSDQARQLLPKFRELARKLREKELLFRSDPAGFTPSQVLVFELIGTAEEFYRAVRRINGLQWLLDEDVGRTDPGDDFFVRDDPTRQLPSRVLAVSANQTALTELMRLFRRFRRGDKLPYGFGTFSDLFAHVRDVRLWDFRDRIEGTGIVEYIEQLARFDQRDLLCGIEIFSTGNDEDDRSSLARVRAEIDRVGGTVHSATALPAIRHVELRATIRLLAVPSIAALNDVRVFHMDDVMFVRPAAQAAVDFEEAIENARESEELSPKVVREEPRLALLDGVPVQNHPALIGRLLLDDPDQFEARSPVNSRTHGTAMASILLNGDLAGTDTPIPERIYVRPILLARPTLGYSVEEIPQTDIPVDVLHRAVVRLFEGPDAVGKQIRVICLCVADRTRPLDTGVSPWARLVDYLSWKYGVLFLLSAGNYPQRLEVAIDNFNPNLVTPTILDGMLLQSFLQTATERPIMSPAEAVNALTIAAASDDASTPSQHTIVPLSQEGSRRPALFNAVGYGYRRAVKPELLFRGGRLAFRVATQSRPGSTGLDAILSLAAPGNEVATPPRTTGFVRGTSNATAFAGRDALELLSLIEELAIVPDDAHLEVALLKALMAHSATWGTAYYALEQILKGKVRPQAIRQNVSRYVGYGFPSASRTTECTESRVTVVAADRVAAEHSMVYRFPLPPAMASKRIQKRLILTLAYLCPMNSAARSYRTHNLWASATFKGDQLRNSFNLVSQQVHEPYVGLGTLQHEVYYGSGAVAFVDGDSLQLQVNCKKDSGTRVPTGIPYGLAATLELLEPIGVDIYQEVRQRMAVPVDVTAIPIKV